MHANKSHLNPVHGSSVKHSFPSTARLLAVDPNSSECPLAIIALEWNNKLEKGLRVQSMIRIVAGGKLRFTSGWEILSARSGVESLRNTCKFWKNWNSIFNLYPLEFAWPYCTTFDPPSRILVPQRSSANSRIMHWGRIFVQVVASLRQNVSLGTIDTKAQNSLFGISALFKKLFLHVKTFATICVYEEKFWQNE